MLTMRRTRLAIPPGRGAAAGTLAHLDPLRPHLDPLQLVACAGSPSSSTRR